MPNSLDGMWHVDVKKAWEIQPVIKINKGKALSWMVRNLSFTHSKSMPWFCR